MRKTLCQLDSCAPFFVVPSVCDRALFCPDGYNAIGNYYNKLPLAGGGCREMKEVETLGCMHAAQPHKPELGKPGDQLAYTTDQTPTTGRQQHYAKKPERTPKRTNEVLLRLPARSTASTTPASCRCLPHTGYMKLVTAAESSPARLQPFLRAAA